jgi:hypothetical protein
MYTLEINGTFKGLFKTPQEALVVVEKWARPFNDHWVIKDPYGKVYAQG